MINRSTSTSCRLNSGVLFFLFLLLLLPGQVKSQSYEDARKFAYSGERQKARAICRELLSVEFDSDVAVLMGRTYAWDGKYDSARVVILPVLDRYPTHWDALDALSDVEYWDDKYPEAIRYCDRALQKDPTDEHFLFKKAKIYSSNDQYEESEKVLKQMLKLNPDNADAINKLKNVRSDLRKNRLRVTYTLDLFEPEYNRDPWHVATFSYGRKTAIGTVIGRVNYANRFRSNGFQIEADAYPSLGEDDYLYLNVGYSPESIFPKVRGGAEWYHSFPHAWEGSLGTRIMHFSASNTIIFTGTVGKYLGDYWFSVRPYVIPSDGSVSISGSVQVRRYFSDPENYLGFRVGWGVSSTSASTA